MVPPDCVTAPVSLITTSPAEDEIVAASLSPPVPFSVSVLLPLLVTVLPLEELSMPACEPDAVVPLIVRAPLDTVTALLPWARTPAPLVELPEIVIAPDVVRLAPAFMATPLLEPLTPLSKSAPPELVSVVVTALSQTPSLEVDVPARVRFPELSVMLLALFRKIPKLLPDVPDNATFPLEVRPALV